MQIFIKCNHVVQKLTQADTCIHVQFISGGLHQPPRGHPVSLPVGGGNDPLHLATPGTSTSQSHSHPRSSERDSRHAITGRWSGSAHGVVPEQQGGTSVVPPVGHSGVGPLCNPVQQQVSEVCIASARPTGSGHRRTVDTVVQPVGVCLPPLGRF